jgi:hypothetical protein
MKSLVVLTVPACNDEMVPGNKPRPIPRAFILINKSQTILLPGTVEKAVYGMKEQTSQPGKKASHAQGFHSGFAFKNSAPREVLLYFCIVKLCYSCLNVKAM